MLLSVTCRPAADPDAADERPAVGSFEILALWPKHPILVDRHLDREIELPPSPMVAPAVPTVFAGTIH